MTDAPHSSLDRALAALLDRHGFGFHYAALNRIRQISEKLVGVAKLAFEVSEFPVASQAGETRIDFILKIQGVWSGDQPVHLVCECKRVNPAFSDWCFLRAPYVRRNREHSRVIVEQICYAENKGWARPVVIANEKRPLEIGLAVKGDLSGQASGDSDRDAIEKAAGQLMRGVNGYTDFLVRQGRQLVVPGPLILLPVLFTTARLHETNMDLSTADLATGKLPTPTMSTPAPWLWFQTHVSPSLRHSASRDQPPGAFESLGGILDAEYSRSIAIVNADGMEEFFQALPSALEMCLDLR